MKIKSTLALPLLLASTSLVMGRQSNTALLRGNRDADLVEEPISAGVASRMGKVPVALMDGGHRQLVTRVAPPATTEEDEAAPAPAPKKQPVAPVAPQPVAKKPAPAPAPKAAAADEEDEEAVVNAQANGNDDDNTLDWDAEMGGATKPKANGAVTKPKVVDQIAPKAQAPVQPKKPAPAPVQEEEEEEEEEEEPVVAAPKKAGAVAAPTEKWWDSDADVGQTPANAAGTGNLITLTVRPNENAVRVNSRQSFTGGRFEVNMRSASVMPGVVTALYLASGKGRTGDGDGGLGDQDEIDFEFKGNDPNRVQTNVFISGKEDLLLVDVGENTSQAAHNYVIEWDDKAVNFMIDGKNVRTKNLDRPLKPMSLHMSVWTTVGGWPGVKAWAGDANWDSNGNKEIVTTLEVISLPKAEA